MNNILKRHLKSGVITTGDDNVKLDSPNFEIINISIDTLSHELSVEVLYEVSQKSLTQKYSRTFKVPFGSLPANVRASGRNFLNAVEGDILKLPQHKGSTVR